MTDAIPLNKAEACPWGRRPDCQEAMSSLHLTPPGDPGQQVRVWGPGGPTWLQMPGLFVRRRRAWGLGEKSRFAGGDAELLCESGSFREA